MANSDEIKASDEFDIAIGEKLGPAESAEDFESDLEIVTPNLDWYEYDEKHQPHMPNVDDITAEAMGNYIGAEIMVSHGDTVFQGSVRSRKGNMEVNNIVRANNNPILDT